MKRRAIVAVLFVVALVALVLVRPGGTDRQEAAATQGKPFIGEAGVIRSVASIKARQRYLDQHPRGERGRSHELAAAEATREEAAGPEVDTIREKPEPGEEGGPPKQAGPTTQQRTGTAAIE